MGCFIRPYCHADFLAVRNLEEEHGHDTYSAGVFVRQAAELYPGTFLVLEEEGEVVGFTIGASVQGDHTRAWCLRLALRTERRHQGLGTQLFRALLDTLRSRGVRECLLTVSPHNTPACRLYIHQGFQVTREERDYFGKGETRYLMKKTL